MYAAAIVNLFIFRCPVRPVRYSSFIFWIWGVLFVSCTSVVPFLFGNAGKVASMTLVKGSRSRGTMTSFLCATQLLFLGESQPGFEEIFPVDMSMHWLDYILCIEWIMPTGVFHVDTETSSKFSTPGVTPCEVLWDVKALLVRPLPATAQLAASTAALQLVDSWRFSVVWIWGLHCSTQFWVQLWITFRALPSFPGHPNFPRLLLPRKSSGTGKESTLAEGQTVTASNGNTRTNAVEHYEANKNQ